jgi:hypothetical protein
MDNLIFGFNPHINRNIALLLPETVEPGCGKWIDPAVDVITEHRSFIFGHVLEFNLR